MPTFVGLLLALLLCLPASTASAAGPWQEDSPQSQAGTAQASATQTSPSHDTLSKDSAQRIPPRPTLRVLFVGNSLTYVNNLPRMVQAIADAQPDGSRIETTSFTAPGGRLDERWEDDAAPEALRNGHWDALVLQEASGLLVCMGNPEQRRNRTCRDSERTHKRFAELAKARGTHVVLYATWGPDESWDQGLDRGHDLMMRVMRNAGADVALIPAGRVLNRYEKRYSREQTRPDGLHPSVSASLVIAALVYRGITGQTAVAHDMTIDFPLLPVNAPMNPSLPLESQAHLDGDGKTTLLKAAALAPLFEVAYAGQ